MFVFLYSVQTSFVQIVLISANFYMSHHVEYTSQPLNGYKFLSSLLH